MKIDSIFSTFDHLIDSVPIYLRTCESLTGDNLAIVRLAHKSFTRLLVDIHDSLDPTFIWGVVSSYYNCVATIPLLEMQDVFTFIHAYFILRDDEDWDFRDFKGLFFRKFGNSAKDAGKMIWPFVNNVIRMVIRRQDFALVNLATLCKFHSKIELVLPELESDCIASYIRDEDYLRTKVDFCEELVEGMNKILKSWLASYNPTFLPVRHGSGSVADCGNSKLEKYCNLATDRKLDLGIAWLHGYSPESYYPWLTNKTLVRTSKYITVPKSLTKRRGISMEPASLQYFQQGVMITLYDYIDKNLPQIPLRNQLTNQRAAWIGSMHKYYCTIDLSSASDLVSYRLVKRVFRGTNLLKYLICTRSNRTRLPNGKIIELEKFAPMGSSLCFPVESLIFASCCEFICRYAKQHWNMFDTSYSVYGDDIIIDNSLYYPMTVALNELGFRVNNEKSFHDGPFRESCGKEYHNGVDVTPLKYRLTVSNTNNISPENYAAVCSTINHCAESGYHQLRKYLLSWILNRRPGPLFVDHFGNDPYLFSPTPTNFNNICRWNPLLYTNEIRYLGVTSRVDRSLLRDDKVLPVNTDDALYLEYLIRREYNPDGLSEFEVDRYSLNTKKTLYSKLIYLL